MVTSSKKNKRHALTILELSLTIFIISLVFVPLGSTSYQFLKKKLYQRDVFRLKNDLQLAYSCVLHCDLPVDVLFEQTKKGATLALFFKNKALQKKWSSKKNYPYIKKMTFNNNYMTSKQITFSEAGDYKNPIILSLYGDKANQKASLHLKGYPHVLEIEKN